jgi:site-specific DNA-methyltransferase (adenine-specific)
MSGYRAINDDCLNVLPGLERRSADLVLTDPPYMIGAKSVGNAKAKSGVWADMENAAYWFSAWLAEAKAILKETGFILVFTNWRSLPMLSLAFARADWPISDVIVWDKLWIGTGSPMQLRNRHELIVMAGNPEARIRDRGQPNVMAEKWMASHNGKHHPAEKPVPLLKKLVDICLDGEPGLVVDLFMGSGSTGVAAAQAGAGFLGIEREPDVFLTAQARLKEAYGEGRE